MAQGGVFSPIAPASAPAGLQQAQQLGSAFPFHDLGVLPTVPEASLLGPLNVHTEQDVAVAALAAQLQVLNVTNQRNNNINCNDTLDFLGMFLPPPASPESVTSSSSGGSSHDSISHTCSSPLEVSRSLRLPIFSKISCSDDGLVERGVA